MSNKLKDIIIDSKTKETAWEKSYSREENMILFPKDEILRFFSKYIAKLSVDQTAWNDDGADDDLQLSFVSRYVMQSTPDKPPKIRGLDFGCGVGSAVLLMGLLNIEGLGIDLSQKAIDIAEFLALENLNSKQRPLVKFQQNNTATIPYRNNYFDFTVCDGVLDSMTYDLAKKCFSEIYRVTDRFIYFSVIGSESHVSGNFNQEETVLDRHESGTIQSYFDINKIKDMIGSRTYKNVTIQKDTKEYCTETEFKESTGFNPQKHTRYHVIVEKY